MKIENLALQQPQSISDDAREAVRVFRQMQYNLTAYARAITGDSQVRVEVTSGPPHTDGKIIRYRPPLALGKKPRHNKQLCDKRDPETKLQLCDSCRVTEEILVNIYHEISHIANKSFEATSEFDQRQALQSAVVEHGGHFADQIQKRWHEASRSEKNTFMGLASVASPFLPLLFNALEDARIDQKMFSTRKGTKKMMEADTYNILRNGIELPNGEYQLWSDQPLNSQVGMGAYLKAAKYSEWEQYFDPKIAEDLSDEKLTELLSKISTALDVSFVYHLSFQILARLRELGYFQLSEEEEKDESDSGDDQSDDGESGQSDSSESKNDQSSDSDGKDGTSSSPSSSKEDQSEENSESDPTKEDSDSSENENAPSSPGSGDSESGEEPEGSDSDSPSGANDQDQKDQPTSEVSESSSNEPSSTESDEKEESSNDLIESDPQGIKSPNFGTADELQAALQSIHSDHKHAPEPSDEEENALQIAIIQGQYFETDSANIIDVNIYSNFQGPAWKVTRKFYGKTQEYGIEVDLNISESALGPALLKLRKVFADNQTAKHEFNLTSGRVNKRVLGRRAWSDDNRLFTKKRIPGKKDYAVLIGVDISSSTLGANLVLAKLAAFGQAELCHRLGIKFAVFAHSATGVAGSWSELSMDIHQVKTWDQPWDTQAKERLSKLVGNGGNVDGHTIEYYRKQLDKIETTEKILMYYTDGKMPASNFDEELEILQREIKVCTRKKITLMAVGINTDSPIQHGLDTVQVENEKEIVKVVNHLGKRLGR